MTSHTNVASVLNLFADNKLFVTTVLNISVASLVSKDIYLEEVPESVVGELGEPGVAESDGGPWVDVELLADVEVLLEVLAVANVPEAPLDRLEDIIEVGFLVFLLLSGILVSKGISMGRIPVE